MKEQLYLVSKRAIDIIVSLLALTIFSPLFIMIAIAIKLESKGPVFYKGSRLGKNRATITIYKFRTMCIDAEEKLSRMLSENPVLAEEWATYQKLSPDPRTTKLGHFLRKTSLDELPDFFCVLKGDISLVGPRAYIKNLIEPEHLAKYPLLFKDIFSVKPGITCLWQISGRSTLTHQDKIFLDSLYSKQKSLAKDFSIILKTIPVVLQRQGAV